MTTPTTPTTQHEAFLQAICESPHDDGPRLMYADWLEERGEQLERAEFIRVQCELSQPVWGGHRTREEVKAARRTILGCCNRHADNMACCCLSDVDPKYDAVRQRERELLGKYQGLWTCWMMDHIPTIHRSPLLQIAARDATRVGGWPSGNAMFCFHRGFVEHVSCTMQNWLDHGPALVRAAPLLEVRLTDREAMVSVHPGVRYRWSQRERWLWRNRPQPPARACELPEELFKRLNGKPPGRWHYVTAELAHADLSRVCIAWAREQAGLPELRKP